MAPPLAADAIPLRRAIVDIRDLPRWALDILHRQAATFDIGLDVRVDENVTMPGGSIAVRVSYELGEVTIAVQDDGPGIPSDRLQTL